jgi:hypothetical protein
MGMRVTLNETWHRAARRTRKNERRYRAHWQRVVERRRRRKREVRH